MARTRNLLEKAKEAKRESKFVDFKERFDPASDGEWCELVKDIVAMANSGGGVVVVGVRNDGTSSTESVKPVLDLDPATFTDKIFKYSGEHFSDVELHDLRRRGKRVAVIKIEESPLLIAFSKPGTYAVASNKQKTAFGRGTVYFRHGAKSEPGTSSDLAAFIERRIEVVRKSWIGGIRKVVSAPPGSKVDVYEATTSDASGKPTSVRVTDDPSAPLFGKLDPDDTHPYRQTDVIPVINAKLPGQTTINRHDIRCIRFFLGIDEKTQPTFCHRPKFGVVQYSDAFVDHVVSEFRRDSEFFARARQTYYQRSRKSN